jgi:predicted nucleotidyltransferase component of viral defense system
MDHTFYFNHLYPFQDQILQVLSRIDTGFYLTGGTALSRGYLNHRFSDDLDFFVNDDDRFGLWAERVIQSLLHSDEWTSEVLLREERYRQTSFSKLNWSTMFHPVWGSRGRIPYWGELTPLKISWPTR